ncbi:MAG: L,D-transpeptidase family protein [Solirubrobacteraceae bacterium]
MARALAHQEAAAGSGRKRVLLGMVTVLLVVLVLVVVAALVWSGATLAADSTALARVSVEPLGGTIRQVQAFGPDGRRIRMSVESGLLTPLERLRPGELVSVRVEVRRPGWLGWALGSETTEHLTLRAPVAQVSRPFVTVSAGAPVRISFDQPVSAIAYGSTGRLAHHHTLSAAQRSVSLGIQPSTGSIEIAAAARPWETIGSPGQVSWFPPSRTPVMASIPAAGARISPSTHIYLTFSKPVREVLGSTRPRLSPSTPGHWHEVNSNTLAFKPSGLGAALGSQLRVQLPKNVAVTAGAHGLRTTNSIEWTVPPGSTLRLQQLLAEAGYLPVVWQPSGTPVARAPSAQAQAAVEPPSGSFSWRYPNTPPQLQAMWSPENATAITKGAVMKFENVNGLTVDGIAGASVWHRLLTDAIAGKRLTTGYSYVYVRREVPETMTLWHNGHIVLSSPANTGISGAETELGTFPVFEHLPETTMSGTNPDGSHYEDPGIKWVSYFNGGDALHNFDRASFGSPQSLGCVELPLEAAAETWPYTPIGTLVTIET